MESVSRGFAEVMPRSVNRFDWTKVKKGDASSQDLGRRLNEVCLCRNRHECRAFVALSKKADRRGLLK